MEKVRSCVITKKKKERTKQKKHPLKKTKTKKWWNIWELIKLISNTLVTQLGLKRTIRPFMMTYSQAVKIQNKKPVRLHHCSVLNKLTILSFDNFITFANLKLLCVHNQAPQVLTDLVVLLKAMGLVPQGGSIGKCKVLLWKFSFLFRVSACGILHLQNSNWTLIGPFLR